MDGLHQIWELEHGKLIKIRQGTVFFRELENVKEDDLDSKDIKTKDPVDILQVGWETVYKTIGKMKGQFMVIQVSQKDARSESFPKEGTYFKVPLDTTIIVI